jgi:AbrB family looped-hinge helix DNA binding protein
MITSRVTSKGQITIPKKIRELLEIDKSEFEIVKRGTWLQWLS